MEREWKHLLVAVVLALGIVNVSTAAITVDVYSGHATTGGGTPYSDFVGTLTASAVDFGTSTGFGWHPLGLAAFGADIFGNINVPADGDYMFGLKSDDGSLLYLDGNLVVDNGGGHGPTTVSGSTFLTAGPYFLEIQFFEDFGGSSGVDLILPEGVTYLDTGQPCPVIPAPAALVLGSIGMGLIGWLRGRRAL